MISIALAFVLFAQTSAASPAVPAAPPAAMKDVLANPELAKEPVDITADVFEIDGRAKRGVFRGNVEVRQGEVLLKAARVEAVYTKQASIPSMVKADGGVTVTSGPKVATAQRAEFNNVQRTVVLSGEPRLWEEGSVLEGREIVFHVDDGRVECFECSMDVDPNRLKEMTDERNKKGAPGGK